MAKIRCLSSKPNSSAGGMRGLMASSTGKTVEIPIKSNFREGQVFLSSSYQVTVPEKVHSILF